MRCFRSGSGSGCIGIAMAVLLLARRVPRADDPPSVRKWTDLYAVAFVLMAVSYLNLQKNPAAWVKARSVPETMLGLSAETWFNFACLALAAAGIGLLLLNQRRPLALLPSTALGRGQLLYLAFLWCMVIGNFERALVSFAPERLVTEGVIHLNAVLCTLGILWPDRVRPGEPAPPAPSPPGWLSRTIAAGLMLTILSLIADWAIVRAVYGDRFAGYANKHIRFGPDATATTEKPKPGLPHP
jgi:hypothetical protein